MKNLVNKRSGKVIATGEWNSVYDAVEDLNPELDENTYSVSCGADKLGGKIWHSYFDLAIEAEMKYSEYKTSYAWCDTKRNSYDANTKTIIVYKQDDDQRI